MVKKNNRLISYTLPRYSGMIIAATLASTLSSFVDGCITGSMLGSDAMAAFGIAMPFVLILAVVAGMILSSGGSICSSKAIGMGDWEKANSNFTACLIMGMIIGVVVTVICFAFPEQLIALTGTEGELAKEANAYLRGYGFGAIPTIILTILMYYANLDGNENLSFLAVLVMTIVDIALDICLGVKLGMGLYGMALATSISYICAVIIFLIFFLIGKSSFSIRLKNLGLEMKDILKTGYPSALNTLLVSCRCFFLNTILLGIAGSEAVSAFSFQSNFNQFFIAIATGVSTAVSVLVGIYIGEKDKNGICSSVKSGFRCGIWLSSIFMIFLFLLAPVMTSLLLSSNAKGSLYAVMALRLYSLSMPLSIINIILISFYQTTGDRKTANTIAIGHGLVLPLGCAYLFSKIFGLNGVWVSTLIAEVIMLVILAIILKMRTGEMPVKLEEFAVIDNSEYPDEESVFRYSATLSELDLNDVKEQLRKFLTDKGCDANVKEQILEVFFNSLNAGKTQARYVDILCAFNNMIPVVNLRFDGKGVDKLLNSSRVEVSSHYSAGISFVGIVLPNKNS